MTVRRRAPHEAESRRTCKVDRPPAARQLFLVSACRRGDAFRDYPGVPSGDDGQFVQRRDGEQEPWFQALEVFGRRGEIGEGRAPTGTEIDGDQFLRTNAAARENDERVPVQKGWRERWCLAWRGRVAGNQRLGRHGCGGRGVNEPDGSAVENGDGRAVGGPVDDELGRRP